MADNLSPLVNLDLINQIYKTINAQITERVYDPAYDSKATLGSEGSRYKSAYLEALDVNGGATVDSLNGLTLTSESTGFKISGGAISKALTVAADVTVRGNITVDAATSISEPLTVVAATTINKPLTVGTDSTGGITLQSSGAGDATIEGPSGGTVTFTAPTSSDLGSLEIKSGDGAIKSTIIVGPNGGVAAQLIGGKYTTSATIENSTTPELNKLLKITNVSKNAFLAGPDTGEAAAGAPTYRQISSDDLTDVTAGSAKKVTANSYPDPSVSGGSDTSEVNYYVTAVQNTGDNKSLYASTEGVYIKRVNSTDSGSSDTTTSYHLYASAVHNAVWNDLADCIEVPEDTNLEFGYCYSWNGDRVEKSSRKSRNCIGIHSNTAGLFMGEKPVKTIQAAVAGFVLAHMDRAYPEGTPLTWGDDGKLVKCGVVKRILHPERVIATFYKEETQETWHGVKVHNRHWVKVR